MNKLSVRGFSFGTYLKIYIIPCLLLGILIGLAGMLMGFFGIEISTRSGAYELVGMKAGLFILVYAPLYMVSLGLVLGVFSYFPFKLLMKYRKEMSIYYIPANGKLVKSDVSNDENVN